jgi:hypothetical protein
MVEKYQFEDAYGNELELVGFDGENIRFTSGGLHVNGNRVKFEECSTFVALTVWKNGELTTSMNVDKVVGRRLDVILSRFLDDHVAE